MRRCVLFTDLANPTSNSIYQAVGYEPVADAAQIDYTGNVFAGATTLGHVATGPRRW